MDQVIGNICFFLSQHRKSLKVTGLIIIILITIIFSTIFIINTLKSSSLLIYVTPTSAKININGQEYTNGVHRLYPSHELTATISQNGFQTKTINFSLQPNQLTKISTYLIPNNDDFSYYESNPEDYKILVQIHDKNDEQVSDFIEKANHKYSITNILPIKETVTIPDPNFNGRINPNCSSVYCMGVLKYEPIQIIDASNNESCQQIVCLSISGDDSIINQMLKEKGYNLNDYQVFSK